MAAKGNFSWEGLWNQATKLMSDGKVDSVSSKKGAVVQKIEKSVKGFVNQQAALVNMTATVDPGMYIGQLMAEAAGFRVNKGALTPASEEVGALLTKPLIALTIAKQNSDEADVLFASLAQSLCHDPKRGSDGNYDAILLTMGELIMCGGIMGIAKLVKLCPGLYVDEKATTLLTFIGSLVYYSDPATLINHLGGTDVSSK